MKLSDYPATKALLEAAQSCPKPNGATGFNYSVDELAALLPELSKHSVVGVHDVSHFANTGTSVQISLYLTFDLSEYEDAEEEFVDPTPWVDRSEGFEWRHSACHFPKHNGCTYEPRTKEQYDAEQAFVDPEPYKLVMMNGGLGKLRFATPNPFGYTTVHRPRTKDEYDAEEN